jgi:ABC-type glycerol-3-phosphate transport system permease component
MLGKNFPTSFNFSNYVAAMESFPLKKFFLNSIIVSVSGMLSQLFVASLAAYAIVFLPIKYKKYLWYNFSIDVYSSRFNFYSKLSDNN